LTLKPALLARAQKQVVKILNFVMKKGNSA